MKGINFNSKQIQLLIEIKRKEIRFQFIHHVCHKKKKKNLSHVWCCKRNENEIIL